MATSTLYPFYSDAYYIPSGVPGQVTLAATAGAAADFPGSISSTRPLAGTASVADSATASLSIPGSSTATLTTQNINTLGLVPIYQAATGSGDSMVADSRSFLHIKNGSGSSMTVTLVTPGVVDTVLPIADRVVSVGPASDRMIAVPPELYQDPTTRLASITYSVVTSVTVAVLRSQ